MRERRYRILFVRPSVDFSVSDVARGYERALRQQGHELRVYDMAQRYVYHANAIGPERAREMVADVSKAASETILLEAMYHNADLVVIVSGLLTHPNALWLLAQGRVPTVVLHTESPYEDVRQAEWSSAHPEALIATHERTSAEQYGWLYLPHAFDPAIHWPVAAPPKYDVVFVGTGWQERIDLFERVDWSGIALGLFGFWPLLRKDSPLRPFYVEGCVQNDDAVKLYRQSRIGLNLHRYAEGAVSLNPRAYELAATETFSVTDGRAEGIELFGETQPTFTSAEELSAVLRRYLADDAGRVALAKQARERVLGQTFAARAETLMDAVERKYAARAA